MAATLALLGSGACAEAGPTSEQQRGPDPELLIDELTAGLSGTIPIAIRTRKNGRRLGGRRGRCSPIRVPAPTRIRSSRTWDSGLTGDGPGHRPAVRPVPRHGVRRPFLGRRAGGPERDPRTVIEVPHPASTSTPRSWGSRCTGVCRPACC
ncbi:hypothetical protein NKG94_31340 [Micromonospora sp. M12]